MDLLIVTGLLGLVLLLLYFYGTRTHGYWKNRGVAFEPPLPIVGNLLDMITLRKNQGQIIADIYMKHPEARTVGMWNFDAPALLVRDPELVYQVLVSDFHSFPNNELEVDPDIDPVMGNNLFCSRGAKWKRSRQVLSPAFTVGKVRSSFPKILTCADKLVKYIESHPGEIQAKNLMALFTSEVVAAWGLGIDGHSFSAEDPVMARMGRSVFEPSVSRALATIVTFLIPIIPKLLKIRFVPEQVPNFFEGVIKDMLHHRKKNGESQHDYLQHFLDFQDKLTSRQNDLVITDDDILDAVVTFFLEGYETSSMVGSFLLYHLAMNPDVQEKLRSEIKAAPELAYDTVAEMTYLNQCFLETTRLQVGLGNMSKTCAEQCQVGDVVVEPGTTVVISMLGLHTDPMYWPDPLRFDPTRFSEEERAKIPKGVYNAFGDGPRICIGIRLANAMVKTAVARILQNFFVVPSARTPAKFTQNPLHFMSAQKGGLYLKFVKISK